MKKTFANRLPGWFRQGIPDDKTLGFGRLFAASGVNTVCREAKCPNVTECSRNNEVTFLILGDTCTRNCRFCNVGKSKQPYSLEDEPERIKELVEELRLDYVVITSVTRDDLADAGAQVFVRTIELIRKVNKDIKIEVLVPDFQGRLSSLQCLLNVSPNVVAHNIETVGRLYAELRPLASYRRSLGLLEKMKQLSPWTVTKSSIMLGLGETEAEVISAMRDLRESKCDFLTLGQYLSPSVNHYPVKEFITLEKFREYEQKALDLGFKAVMSGPKVRSSYRARKMYEELLSCTI